MKVCERLYGWDQVCNYEGDVRVCGWIRNPIIGNLLKDDLKTIYSSKRMKELQDKLSHQDYSECNIDACPWLSRGIVDKHLEEYDKWPDYPQGMMLAFEHVCNYACSSCGVSQDMKKRDWNKAEANAQLIENKLREILPHMRRIGGNGLGELFCSKHTLRLLADWKPLAPKEECSVVLETNGSLFDAEHWKMIENLGQYHLSVAITVMSFEEHTYQVLSGTKLPIEQIESNLRFVKGLREKGIIDYLELATVVQERNFWQMPELTRRFLEEFGADHARLRAYEPWHSRDPITEWFTDIRAPEHPYHQEWREVMSHPIFKDPRVGDGSGGRDSLIGEYPLKKENRALKNKVKVLSDLLLKDSAARYINEHIPESAVLIYGLSAIGKKLAELFVQAKKSAVIIDRFAQADEYKGVKVVRPENATDVQRELPVIITPVTDTANIAAYLKHGNFTGRMIDVCEFSGIAAEI